MQVLRRRAVRDADPGSDAGELVDARSRRFHVSTERAETLLAHCPRHAATPLVAAPGLAAAAGVAEVWLKDESARMGLGSFKALGGAFAVAQTVRDATELALGARLEVADLTSDPVRKIASGLTFITASAGNHGLSVAAGARVFGARAVIVLGADVPEAFAARLRALDATVQRVDVGYEASVAHAANEAETHGWLHLADGSWEGFLAPPALVMEGYCVLAGECAQSFRVRGDWPTHVLLQAGVGGLAAAVAGHIRTHWDVQPEIIVVEPERAACLYASMAAGTLTEAPGPTSNMGRLDCKVASLLAFESLAQDADVFVTISDTEASAAVEHLHDGGLASTPSGAAGVAALLYGGDVLSFGAKSRVLAIVSEGAVDS